MKKLENPICPEVISNIRDPFIILDGDYTILNHEQHLLAIDEITFDDDGMVQTNAPTVKI